MIDEYWTWIIFGYHSDELKPKSNKKIVAVCDICFNYRAIQFRVYNNVCGSCVKKGIPRPPRSQEWCNNISNAKKGKKSSEETKLNQSKARKGVKHGKYTEERCQQISAGKQGIPYEEWNGFVSNGEYCHKFNDEIKEYIRNKYNRLCYVCDKNEKDNGRKLDVHHTDMNKDQGCDEHDWKLVPLCRSCHSSAHAEPLKSRIEYLRADEERSSV